MCVYHLILYPFKKNPIQIPLWTEEPQVSENIKILKAKHAVYHNLSYTAFLQSEEVDGNAVKDVLFYINDDLEECVYQNGEIQFSSEAYGEKRIFQECYGFINFTLVLKYCDGTETTLYSDYLSVLVQQGAFNDSVKAMAQYVYAHQEDLLFHGDGKPKALSDRKPGGFQSMESFLALAKEIALLYENSYSYFMANCRFKVEQKDTVDYIEKLQCINSRTVQYIVNHPEQLKSIATAHGIWYNKRPYQPQKTLTVQNAYSKDIYENQVIVGFLKNILGTLQEAHMKISQFLMEGLKKEAAADGYVHSSYFIFAQTQKQLEKKQEQLKILANQFSRLLQLYQQAMPVRDLELLSPPRPSPIFLSVPQYHRIFIKIQEWFTFGIYNLENEKFLFSFSKISVLYECYVLAKLIVHFKASYGLEPEKRKCAYPISQHWKYHNTNVYNTFLFDNGIQKTTLYYQPVIYHNDKRHINQIGLYRNTKISLSKDWEGSKNGTYYVPDYIIKIENGGVSKYIICDAKFSSLSTIEKYYISNLAFKYLFSISPITDKDILAGLCVIYAQCNESNDFKTVYDNQLPGTKILPFAQTLPLAENRDNSKHTSRINKLCNI